MNIPKLRIADLPLAPGWIALVPDVPGQSYAKDVVLYVAPPKCVDAAPEIARQVVDAINQTIFALSTGERRK